MLKPFPFLAEGGIRPPTSILWQFEPIHRHVLPVASHGMCWTVISNNLSTTSHALSPPLTQTIKGVGVALCNRLTLEEPTGRSGSTISLIKTTDGGATWSWSEAIWTWFLRPCCVSWDMRSLCQVCHGTLWFPSLLDRAWLKTTGRWLMILRWEWSFQDLKFVTSRGTYKSC